MLEDNLNESARELQHWRPFISQQGNDPKHKAKGTEMVYKYKDECFAESESKDIPERNREFVAGL